MNAAVRTVKNSSDNELILRSKFAAKCESAFQQMRNLLIQGKFCDITVKIGRVEFLAHKIVLAAVSQYFSDVLDGDDGWKGNRTVKINFMSPATFKTVREYIYSGDIEITSENVEDLIVASKALRMDTLEEECSEAISLLLSPTTWYATKAIAGENCDEKVYRKCLAYAVQHFTEISGMQEFLQYPFSEVKELVNEHDVAISSQEEIYSAIMKWVKHDLRNRRKNIFELMKEVKLSLMDKTFFMKNVIGEALLRDDLRCTNLLLEATSYHSGIQPDSSSKETHPDLQNGGENLGELLRKFEFAMFELSLSGTTLPQKDLKQECIMQKVPCIFVTGGEDKTGAPMFQSECYNPQTKMWNPISKMRWARRSHAAVGYGGLLYVFGGMCHEKIYASAEYYHPTKDTWRWIKPLPYPRHLHGICSNNDSIFICGGITKDHQPLSTVEMFDPATTTYMTCPPMRSERVAVKMAVTGGSLYAVGDWNEELDTVERFDPREGRWFPIRSRMTIPRWYPGVTTLNKYIYCTGGMDCSTGKCTNSGERFNIRRNRWETIPNMLSVRRTHELVTLDGCIYAIGDESGLNSVEKFDPNSSRWVEMPSMIEGRHSFRASVLEC